MTYSLKTLFYRNATTEDASFPITEMFYEPETFRLRYAALDIGGWFDRREVLLSLDRFDTPREEGWPVAMSRDEIEAAPEWEDAPKADMSLSLPPLIVGPFGSTFSPMLFAAQFTSAAETPAEPAPKGESGQDRLEASLTDASGRIFAMEPASPWLGRSAFGPDGELGMVEDITVDRDLVMQTFVLSEGSERAVSQLRRVAEQGHALFD